MVKTCATCLAFYSNETFGQCRLHPQMVPKRPDEWCLDWQAKETPHIEINLGDTRPYREEAKEVLAFLNEKSGRRYREIGANLDMIIARLKSGVTVQQCKTLIARKVRDWGADEKMAKYLRPETLFNRTKFEAYLAEVTL